MMGAELYAAQNHCISLTINTATALISYRRFDLWERGSLRDGRSGPQGP